MNGKTIILSLMAAAVLTACHGTRRAEAQSDPGLKDVFGEKFLIGAALNTDQASGKDTAAVRVVRKHFNSIVAENCMKCEVIHPEEDRYDFTRADELVRFGEDNGMTVIGHCLIWHSQLPSWFCTDKDGNNVSAEVLKQRMKEHITTVVSRYKGRVKGWDVVNEAIVEDGSYRKSKFFEILGEEFIPLAFRYAHEADPQAELYYNDYGMSVPGRRDAVVRMVNSLRRQGIRIDAVGMQGHMGMDYPTLEEFEAGILAFAGTGVKVMITEWDMSALPTVGQSANVSDTVAARKALNPYTEALPDSVSAVWNARMTAFFELFLKHAEVISRVTVWGVGDGDSWKNDFPVPGRRDYPLLFDRRYEPKPFVRELVAPKTAMFDGFVYGVDGQPAASDSPVATANPVLPGCYPDPSVCRVGEDYYLVNSSFACFPGVPIWHSTDLKHWKRLGYVLNRPSQLMLNEGLSMTSGIYAPDIKYNPHDKLFYMVTTAVRAGGNFFVTTDDPKKGTWSDPVFLPEVEGIDPAFLFDDDGKAYIVHNGAPEGKPEYDGHRAIWIHEFDWKNGRTVGRKKAIVDGGVDKSKKPIWIEGPHLYRVKGMYYLMAAEGGTGDDHSEVVFVSDSPWGPFKPCAINPILTQRDLPADRPNPVTCVGHADLVQTPSGDWYAVFLGVRPYREGHDIMGRETFLLPVEWKNNQPVILPAGEAVAYAVRPQSPTPMWTAAGLEHEAFFLRTPQRPFHEIGKDGRLALKARSVGLNQRRQPSVIGRWITENTFFAQTALDFEPLAAGDFAGLVLFQNDECNIRFGKTLDGSGKPCLLLSVYSQGKSVSETVLPLSSEAAKRQLRLKVSGDAQGRYTFGYAARSGDEWVTVGEPVSADLLSTKTAKGFTGTMVGIHAEGNYLR